MKKDFKILLAEDNEANQVLIERMLIKGGHSVTIVNNGQEALDELNKDSYDICLIDMQMPVMGGEQAIKSYKSEQPQSELPFVVLTADETESAIERCKKAGADMYLIKPISSSSLLKAINSVCLDGQSTVPASVGTVIDMNQLDYFNDQTFLDEFIEIFESSADSLLSNLSVSLDNDFDSFLETVHSIKGLSGNIGAKGLRELTVKAEKINKEEYSKLSNEHYKCISNELSKVKSELAKLSSKNSKPV